MSEKVEIDKGWLEGIVSIAKSPGVDPALIVQLFTNGAESYLKEHERKKQEPLVATGRFKVAANSIVNDKGTFWEVLDTNDRTIGCREWATRKPLGFTQYWGTKEMAEIHADWLNGLPEVKNG